MILITGGAYQGKGEFAKSLGIGTDKILFDAHLRIRELLEKGGDIKKEFEELLSGVEAVICDAIGMGIVPIDAAEREWREIVGRLMCDTAQKADTVYRLVCGIPIKLKG